VAQCIIENMPPAAFLALLLAVTPLENALQERTKGFEGEVFLYARNLDTGASIGIRETERVRTASTIKLPIMLAVFDAVERSQAKWTETLPVAPAEKVSGSGVLASEFSDGVRLPLRDVVNLMIVLSDNTATNIVLERFSGDAVNAYLDKIGIRTTRVLRKVMDKEARGWSAAGKLPENEKFGLGVSTPRDMVTILEKLERGEIVSPKASKEMLEILRRCQDNTGIRRRLEGMQIANKTGTLSALRADSGIVYSPGGRIAISITVDGMPKPAEVAAAPR
jgi:beta-lactamase class A